MHALAIMLCSAVCLKHTHFLIDQYFFYSEVFYWYHDKNHYKPEKQCSSNSLKLQFFVLALQSLNFRRIDLIFAIRHRAQIFYLVHMQISPLFFCFVTFGGCTPDD